MNPIFAAALEVQAYVDALPNGFAGRRSDAPEFALRYRVVLVRSQAGVPVGIALGAMLFEERAVARASEFVIQPGVALVTCSAEDLIVFKAFAGREAGPAGHRGHRAAPARATG